MYYYNLKTKEIKEETITSRHYLKYYLMLFFITIIFIILFVHSNSEIEKTLQKSDQLLMEIEEYNSSKLSKTMKLKTSYTKMEKVNKKTPIKPLSTTLVSQEEQNKIETVTINIPEGVNIYELINYLRDNKIVNTKDFLSAIKDKNYYNSLRKEYSILPEINNNIRFLFEGYLLGGELKVKKDYDAKDIIEEMVKNMNTTYSKLNKNNSSVKSYKPHEILTIASIVEQESNHSGDRKIIAGVFYNRLSVNQKLQSDVTVLYAHGSENRRVLYKDLKLPSLYNTYYVKGLPVGPITSPSSDALSATLNPNNNNYYYFFGTGVRTIFAKTYEQHLKNINKYT